MTKFHLKIEISLDKLLEELVVVALSLIAERDEKEPDPEFKDRLKEALRSILQKDIVKSDICGLMVSCAEGKSAPPWTKESEEL